MRLMGLLPGGEGLSYYNARWYDAQLGRFVSPDSIVPSPSSPQAFNRYTYVNNSPVNHTDPTGHDCDDGPQTWAACYGSGKRPVSNIVRDAADRRSSKGTVTLSDVVAGRRLYWLNVTKWLARTMNYAAKLPETRTMRSHSSLARQGSDSTVRAASSTFTAMYMFTMLVKNNAPMDVKVRMRRGLGEFIQIGDKWFEYSTPGNILFGFFGKAAGFSDFAIHAGAGAAQANDYFIAKRGEATLGSASTFYDTPDDSAAISLGRAVYNRTIVQGREVTEDDIVALLPSYADGMAVVEPPPSASAEMAPLWPYQPRAFTGPDKPWPGFMFPSFQ